MISKHLALAAYWLLTLFAVIINLYLMLLANLLLYFLINQLINYGNKFVNESIAASHVTCGFYLFTAIWAFWFELQALSYAALTIQF
jgi:uncharacterized membrane protein